MEGWGRHSEGGRGLFSMLRPVSCLKEAIQRGRVSDVEYVRGGVRSNTVYSLASRRQVSGRKETCALSRCFCCWPLSPPPAAAAAHILAWLQQTWNAGQGRRAGAQLATLQPNPQNFNFNLTILYSSNIGCTCDVPLLGIRDVCNTADISIEYTYCVIIGYKGIGY